LAEYHKQEITSSAAEGIPMIQSIDGASVRGRRRDGAAVEALTGPIGNSPAREAILSPPFSSPPENGMQGDSRVQGKAGACN
jgi:hypothetical protein